MKKGCFDILGRPPVFGDKEQIDYIKKLKIEAEKEPDKFEAGRKCDINSIEANVKIEWNCPQCNTELEFDTEWNLGDKIQCPKCNLKFDIDICGEDSTVYITE